MDVKDENFKHAIENGYKVALEGIRISNDLGKHKNNEKETLTSLSKRVLSITSTILRNENVKGNINGSVNDKFDVLINTNNKLLERAVDNMVDLDGVSSNPPEMKKEIKTPVTASWNEQMKKTVLEMKQKTERERRSRILFLKTRNLEKPQLKFKVPVDNGSVPFVPVLMEKPNALVPLSIHSICSGDGTEHYCNPYEYEINHLPIPETLLTKTPPIEPNSLDATPFIYVDDEDKLKSMVYDLGNQKEIAVDLENHSYHSFQGFTCLIQISSRSTDYVIDAIMLRDKLWRLNNVFTDPKVLKVFHSAECDIIWLQRDFCLYVVNMFDTRQAAEVLNFEKLGLAVLLEKFCKVKAKKEYQLYDWRIRPLPSEVLKYARMDTHYLLYIHDILRNNLLDMKNGVQMMKSVFAKSAGVCTQRYNKDMLTDSSHLKVFKSGKRNFDNRQMFAIKQLYDWRDSVARVEDESTGYVLPNHMLIQIADILPREPQGILACCNPVPPLVKEHLGAIHEIVKKARSMEIIKAPIMDRQIARSYVTHGPVTSQKFNLHDTTDSPDFRRNLPTLLAGTDVTSVDLDQNNKKTDTACTTQLVLDVFDEKISIDSNKSNVDAASENRFSFLSPYERYQKTMLFNEAQREKAVQSSIQNDNIENVQHDEICKIKTERADPNDTSESAMKETTNILPSTTPIKEEVSEPLETVPILGPATNKNEVKKKHQKNTKSKEAASMLSSLARSKQQIADDVNDQEAYKNLENVRGKTKINITSSGSNKTFKHNQSTILHNASNAGNQNNNRTDRNANHSFSNKSDRKATVEQNFDYSKVNFSKFMSNSNKTKNSFNKYKNKRNNIQGKKFKFESEAGLF